MLFLLHTLKFFLQVLPSSLFKACLQVRAVSITAGMQPVSQVPAALVLINALPDKFRHATFAFSIRLQQFTFVHLPAA